MPNVVFPDIKLKVVRHNLEWFAYYAVSNVVDAHKNRLLISGPYSTFSTSLGLGAPRREGFDEKELQKHFAAIQRELNHSLLNAMTIHLGGPDDRVIQARQKLKEVLSAEQFVSIERLDTQSDNVLNGFIRQAWDDQVAILQARCDLV